ncbi:MAG: EamA family transporter [Rudaea sp.]
MRTNIILIVAVLLYGIWGIANKFAVARAHPFTVQWMFAVPLIVSLPIFYWLGARFAPETNRDSAALFWAAVASAASILATLLLYFALRERPASVVVAITSGYPLVTLVLAVLAGTESFTLPKVVGVLLMFGGVVLLQLS